MCFHCFPVTKILSFQTAMPLRTCPPSQETYSPGYSNPVKLINCSTLPSFGSIMAITCSKITFAYIFP